jgi:RNA polymerase sigma-70 factor (ECF subfamily)
MTPARDYHYEACCADVALGPDGILFTRRVRGVIVPSAVIGLALESPASSLPALVCSGAAYIKERMSADDSASLPVRAVGSNVFPTDNLEARVVALYESHREGIYRFLVGHGLSPGEAQETTQDVFIDLLLALRKGVTMNSEQGWLYAVAGRAAVDYWRRTRRGVHTVLDINSVPATTLPSTEPSPETQAEHVQRVRRVAGGIASLPKEQRMCIQLRMQGLRYREIADILGVSTSTAAEWLTAAVKHLRGAAS